MKLFIVKMNVYAFLRRSKIELGDVTPHNIKQLKLLNQVVFPVSYNDKFYKDVLDAGELAKLAYYNDIVVSLKNIQIKRKQNKKGKCNCLNVSIESVKKQRM